ncbi:MAG: isoleucine--tRNA ligase [Clostridia bacterium]|nr:isoleucine--tRNA ligase [Clostridia bacterium]
MANDFSKTLNLPNTSFAMRAGLPQREPEMLREWDKKDLYKLIMERNADKPKFILHDGPPYANGDIHIGHALNKILKDFIVRYSNMSGYCAPYVPGWDCHGLPAESAIIKQTKLDRDSLSVSDFRNKCKDFVLSYVDKQREGFKRLGGIGDWDNPYLTVKPEFEAKQIEVFGEMAKKGYIYKGMKPVYWCAYDKTALAEAEIEYQDDPCDSIYVKFAVTDDIDGRLKNIPGVPEKLYFVIWTTTTWTLPGNMAISLNPDFDYSVVKVGDEAYIMAKELTESVMKDAGIEEYEILADIRGRDMDGMKAAHPFLDRVSYILCGYHVTLEGGTGCVHTAPGFGVEDFDVWRKYDGLPEMIVPVDASGRQTELAGKYAGMTTAESNVAILNDIKESGALLATKKLVHSYPHCWRCKNPIIYRATEQWFASVSDMTADAVKACDDIRWVPAWGKERMVAMIRERADWCISRQRNWGVPIPIFYCADCGEYIINEETIKAVSDLFRAKGSNAWYDMEADEIVPAGLACPKCGCKHFTKEHDIMDVWFDSGSSHAAVLEERDDLVSPADIYLEGGDQYRGWFQSSMLTSIAARGRAPYKQIITHGWTVDGEGKAMHKSLGNAVSPKEVIDTYGADILRLWVSSVDYTVDVRISKDILKQLADVYRKIRNTARIMIANLGDAGTDFDPDKDMIPQDKLPDIDKWLLSKLNSLVKEVREAYENYQFHIVYHAISNFCTLELSKLYIDIAKDRAYVEEKDSFARRSAQTTMYLALDAITRLIAPMLAYTSDEIWQIMPHRSSDDKRHVLLNDMPAYDAAEPMKEIEERYDRLFDMRDTVLFALENARNAKLIGKSLEAKVTVKCADDDTLGFLASFGEELADVFIVSAVSLAKGECADGQSIEVNVSRAEGEKCARCWKHSVNAISFDGEFVCPRCKAILG